MLDFPEDEALAQSLMASEECPNLKFKGSNGCSTLKGPDILILTACLGKKSGMPRIDLLANISGVMKYVSLEVAKICS